MSKDLKLQGGCFCGKIKYSASAEPFDSDYCHCNQCRLSVGSVVVAWMDFKLDQIQWSDNKPKEYKSSEKIRRGFCDQCGTSLSYRHVDYPDYYSLTNASLDDPNLLAPKYHIHTNDQVQWLNIKDDCQRYPNKREE